MALKPIFQRQKPGSQLVQMTPFALTETGARVPIPKEPGHYPTVKESTAVATFGAHIDECETNTAAGRLPRTTFQSSETDAIAFTIDMTGASVEEGAVYIRHLGVSELLDKIVRENQMDPNTTPTGAVVKHFNQVNNFDFIDALANREGIELQDLYVEVGEGSSMRNYAPEEFLFNFKGFRVNQSTDKKKFQDAQSSDTNKNVLRIDSNRVHLNGMRTLEIRVPKGEKVSFRFKYKTSY